MLWNHPKKFPAISHSTGNRNYDALSTRTENKAGTQITSIPTSLNQILFTEQFY